MRKILLLILVVWAAMACNDEQAMTAPNRQEAPLTPVTITRAGDTQWAAIENGSSYTLVVKDATDSEKTANYEYNNGKWEKTGGNDIACGDGSYPAYAFGWIHITEANSTVTEQLPVIWTGQLTTTLTADAAIAQPIEMSIATARFKVTLIGAYSELQYWLSNFKITSTAKRIGDTFNPPAGDPYSNPYTINISTDDAEWNYRTNAGYSTGNIAPQTIAASSTLFTITDSSDSDVYGGKSYTVTTPNAIELKAGKEYHYTIALQGGAKAQIVAQSSNDINDFADGGNQDIRFNHGIRTEAELRQFAADYNTEDDAAIAKYIGTVRLLADIDMSNTPFTPINRFDGTFDGEGHTISGLHIESDGDAGLFKSIASSSVVRNLHLRQTTIMSTGSVGSSDGGGPYIGGIAACNDGTIAACSFEGSLSISGANPSGGGIVGFNDGSIRGCYSLATAITAANKYGIAGDNMRSSDIKGCHWLGGSSLPTEASNYGNINNCYSFTSANNFYTNTNGLLELMNAAIGTYSTMRWISVNGGYPALN